MMSRMHNINVSDESDDSSETFFDDCASFGQDSVDSIDDDILGLSQALESSDLSDSLPGLDSLGLDNVDELFSEFIESYSNNSQDDGSCLSLA